MWYVAQHKGLDKPRVERWDSYILPLLLRGGLVVLSSINREFYHIGIKISTIEEWL